MNAPAHPNVLLIIADDWSPLSKCYGNPIVRTPHIDRLAQRSTVFDHAFCASPSCAVSRANLLTGQHVHTHGQYGHTHAHHGFRTFDHVVSVPRVLNDHGYRTANIGKHHVAPDDVYPFHFREGFNEWSSRSLANSFRRFLDETGDQPFFTMYAPMYPHRRGPGAGYGLEKHVEEFNDQPVAPADVIVPTFLPDLPAVRADLAAYYTAVARLDHCVGEALQVLEETGKAESTLVLLLSDHGMPFPGAKASSFDTGHHCPLIVHRPGVNGGEIHNDALVNWTDVAPTVYEWCGLRREGWPSPLHGKSFLSLLGQERSGAAWDQTVFSHCFHGVQDYFPYRVLRERRYKYVRNLMHRLLQPVPTDLFRSNTWTAVLENNLQMMGQRPTQRYLHHDREALFDLEADPLETNNLAEHPAYSQIVDRMRQQLLEFRQRDGDPWLEIDRQEHSALKGTNGSRPSACR